MPPAGRSPGAAAARRRRAEGPRSSPEGSGGRAIMREPRGFIPPASAAGQVETPDPTGPRFRQLRHGRSCLGLSGPKRPWMSPPSRRLHHPVPAARPQGRHIGSRGRASLASDHAHSSATETMRTLQLQNGGIRIIPKCIQSSQSESCSRLLRFLDCTLDARRGGRAANSSSRALTSNAGRAREEPAPGTGGRE